MFDDTEGYHLTHGQWRQVGVMDISFANHDETPMNLHMYPTTSHIFQIPVVGHHKVMSWSDIVLRGKMEKPVWYIMLYHLPIKVVEWAELSCFINQAVGKAGSF